MLMQIQKGVKSDAFATVVITLWGVIMAGVIIYGSIIKDDKIFFLGLIGAFSMWSGIMLQGDKIRKLEKTLKK